MSHSASVIYELPLRYGVIYFSNTLLHTRINTEHCWTCVATHSIFYHYKSTTSSSDLYHKGVWGVKETIHREMRRKRLIYNDISVSVPPVELYKVCHIDLFKRKYKGQLWLCRAADCLCRLLISVNYLKCFLFSVSVKPSLTEFSGHLGASKCLFTHLAVTEQHYHSYRGVFLVSSIFPLLALSLARFFGPEGNIWLCSC